MLDKYLKNDTLKCLLGSQGSYNPIMNVVHLAFLWNVMSIEGIWFPSCAIHGIDELMVKNIEKHGGIIKKNTEVVEILIENNKAVGVKTKDGSEYKAEWIVCNADYKQVFLNLIDSKFLPKCLFTEIGCVRLACSPGSFAQPYPGLGTSSGFAELPHPLGEQCQPDQPVTGHTLFGELPDHSSCLHWQFASLYFLD